MSISRITIGILEITKANTSGYKNKKIKSFPNKKPPFISHFSSKSHQRKGMCMFETVYYIIARATCQNTQLISETEMYVSIKMQFS